jgi:hypothetical protein
MTLLVFSQVVAINRMSFFTKAIKEAANGAVEDLEREQGTQSENQA